MTKSLLPTSDGICQRCQSEKRLTVSATHALRISGGEHRLCTNHAAAASHQHGIAHPVFNPRGEVMKTALLVLAALLISGCNEPEGPALPVARHEMAVDLGHGWVGHIVELPSGERILLTRISYSIGSSSSGVSTSAVLLPPLNREAQP